MLLAAKKGHTETVNALIKAGADVDKTMNDDSTAFLIAAEKDHLAIVELLVKDGVNKETAMPNGKSSIIAAIKNNNEKLACMILDKITLDNTSDIDQATSDGEIALIEAATRGCVEVTKKS